MSQSLPRSNPFETSQRKLIPAVLVYLFYRGKVLMVHRNAEGRSGDYHAGKWNGLGGKLEADESALGAAVREVAEESGVSLEAAQLCALGTLHFPLFKPQRSEDWLAFLFRAELTPEQAQAAWKKGPEGDLHWVSQEDLNSLNLWAGDRYFIPKVVSSTPVLGTLWYRGQDVERVEFVELGR